MPPVLTASTHVIVMPDAEGAAAYDTACRRAADSAIVIIMTRLTPESLVAFTPIPTQDSLTCGKDPDTGRMADGDPASCVGKWRRRVSRAFRNPSWTDDSRPMWELGEDINLMLRTKGVRDSALQTLSEWTTREVARRLLEVPGDLGPLDGNGTIVLPHSSVARRALIAVEEGDVDGVASVVLPPGDSLVAIPYDVKTFTTCSGLSPDGLVRRWQARTGQPAATR